MVQAERMTAVSLSCDSLLTVQACCYAATTRRNSSATQVNTGLHSPGLRCRNKRMVGYQGVESSSPHLHSAGRESNVHVGFPKVPAK